MSEKPTLAERLLNRLLEHEDSRCSCVRLIDCDAARLRDIEAAFEEARAASAPVIMIGQGTAAPEETPAQSRAWIDAVDPSPASAVPPDLPIPELPLLMNAGRWQDATMLLIRKVDALHRRQAPSASGEGERQELERLRSDRDEWKRLANQSGEKHLAIHAKAAALREALTALVGTLRRKSNKANKLAEDAIRRNIVSTTASASAEADTLCECADAIEAALASASSGDAGTGAATTAQAVEVELPPCPNLHYAVKKTGDVWHCLKCGWTDQAASPKAGPA